MVTHREDFWSALKSGNRFALEALLAGEPELAHSKTEEGVPALLLAVYHKQAEMAEALIQHGAVVDIFAAAATGRELDARALLVSDPGRATQSAPDGFTPLGLAAFFGHASVVDTLLRLGADVNQPALNDLAACPLHSAAAARQIEIARRLIEAGADVNAREGGGFTPLHIAAGNGQLALVTLLLESGADPEALTQDGKTARELAKAAGHTLVADRLAK